MVNNEVHVIFKFKEWTQNVLITDTWIEDTILLKGVYFIYFKSLQTRDFEMLICNWFVMALGDEQSIQKCWQTAAMDGH